MSLVTLPNPPVADSGDALCQQLESGLILFAPRTPAFVDEDDLALLLRQERPSGAHKNIAYRPHDDRVTGLASRSNEEISRLAAALRTYSERMTEWMSVLVPAYARAWKVDFVSFRPQEEEGRRLSPRQRNDLLHTDAFPSRPTNGARILRAFTNINPTRPRHWITSDPLDVLLPKLLDLPRFPRPAASRHPALRWAAQGLARAVGLPVLARSPYDDFMLRLHNFLKQSDAFQETCAKHTWRFPPHSSWVVFTDTVPHAVLSGRFVLEQTYMVPHAALLAPEAAPLTLAERIAGSPLTA